MMESAYAYSNQVSYFFYFHTHHVCRLLNGYSKVLRNVRVNSWLKIFVYKGRTYEDFIAEIKEKKPGVKLRLFSIQ